MTETPLTPEEQAAREPRLPAPFGAEQLDVDGLAALVPALQLQLVDAIRASATAMRAARGTVVTPEDGYALTRRLTYGGEVLRQVSRVFAAAAAECDALVEEEALTAVGESDGIPNGSYFVPDGAGQRIAVRAEYAAGKSTWDLETFVGWAAETTTAEWAEQVDDAAWTERDALAVAQRTVALIRSLASITPAVAKVEQARLRAAEKGDDATAAVLGQLRSVGEREYKGIKITREPQPKGRAK